MTEREEGPPPFERMPGRLADTDDIIPYDRLPAGFAESVERIPDEPVAPRPAATVVLMREGGSGVEILLLRRSRTSGFVPGAWVFPGGRVDREDADPVLVARLDGIDETAAEARLLTGGSGPPAVAYYLAAVREAFEETALLLAHREGRPVAGSGDPRLPRLRDALMADEVTFPGILDRLGSRIDGSALEYIAHWITPAVEPRRYDTRFFAAAVPPGAEAVLDAREMTDAIWVTPEEALRRRRQGSMPMVFPTIRTLEDLCGFGGPRDVLAAFRERQIPAILPRLVRTPTGIGIQVPDEDRGP